MDKLERLIKYATEKLFNDEILEVYNKKTKFSPVIETFETKIIQNAKYSEIVEDMKNFKHSLIQHILIIEDKHKECMFNRAVGIGMNLQKNLSKIKKD